MKISEERVEEQGKPKEATPKDLEKANADQPEQPEKPPEQKQPEKPPETRKPIEKNVVLVGKSPTMNYVLAVVTAFGDDKEVHILARGRSISRAVDVAEVVCNKFVKDATQSVELGTEEIIGDDNRKINVSTIKITLKKA